MVKSGRPANTYYYIMITDVVARWLVLNARVAAHVGG